MREKYNQALSADLAIKKKTSLTPTHVKTNPRADNVDGYENYKKYISSQYEEAQKSVNRKAALDILLMVGGFLLFCFIFVFGFKSLFSNPSANAIEENVPIESKISAGISDFKYTKSSYPKLYEKWGDDGLDRINALLPQAVNTAAKNANCDKVEIVEISNERSIPTGKIVFFADCSNGKRFYISDSDIASGDVVAAEQDKKYDIADAIRKCDAKIKSALPNPSNFSSNMLDTTTDISPSGNIVVFRGFSVKNEFGTEIDYKVRCVVSKNSVDAELM